MSRADELFAKYGSAWRHVFLLEKELQRRRTNRHLLMFSIGLNVALLVNAIARLGVSQ